MLLLLTPSAKSALCSEAARWEECRYSVYLSTLQIVVVLQVASVPLCSCLLVAMQSAVIVF